MARKPGKNGRSSTATATTLLMPPDSEVRGLSKAKQNADKARRSAGESFNTRFAKAQEEKHLDKRAAKIVFGLDALSKQDLHVTYFHLIRYMDDLKIPERATEQEEMFEAGETGHGVANGEDTDGGKVTQIGTAARRVAEAAGASD